MVAYPLVLERLEGIFYVAEVLLLDADPIDEVFPAILATTFRVFRESFRFAKAMKIIWAICRVAAQFEWLKRLFFLLHGICHSARPPSPELLAPQRLVFEVGLSDGIPFEPFVAAMVNRLANC